MPDLIGFINARLADDERAAQAAPGTRWHAFRQEDIAGAAVYDDQWLLLTPAHYDHDKPMSAAPGATGPAYIEHHRDELAAHIARHDPARVLREVEAKRKIVARYQASLGYDNAEDEARCWLLGEIVEALASAWSDHPDYNPDWTVAD